MRQLRLTAIVVLVMSLLAACGATTTTSVPTQPPIVDTSIQLSWFHSLEFAGLYEAQTQKYFEQQNLNVTINQGGFGADGAYIDPVTQVLSGTSKFGVAGADVVLRARAGGAPIVAVASIYQRNPVALISLPGSNITTPKDLEGKKIGIAPPGTTVYISYRALLQEQGIDPASVTEIPEDPATSVPDLLSGKIDVLHSFVTHETVQAKVEVPDLNVMLLSDYGIDLYSNVIFTTETMVTEHPDEVQRFVTAVTQGLTWAVDHPEDAAQHIVDTYGAAMPPPVQATQKDGMLASVPLIRPAGLQPGMMTAEVWNNTHQVLLDQKLIEQPLDVAKAYNLSFVNKAYGK